MRWDLEGWGSVGCGLKEQGLEGQVLQEGGRSSQGLSPCFRALFHAGRQPEQTPSPENNPFI